MKHPNPAVRSSHPLDNDSRFIENRLAGLLEILAAGRFELFSGWHAFLVPDKAQILHLSQAPGPRLQTAWRNLVAAALADNPTDKTPVTFILTPQLTALAVVSANLLALVADGRPETTKPAEFIITYNHTLLSLLETADNWREWLLYDSFTTPVATRLREKRLQRRENDAVNELFRKLSGISPLSELQHFDLGLPEAIRALTGSYLVRQPGEAPVGGSGGETETAGEKRRPDRKWWLRSEDIYGDQKLRRRLIDRWLELPGNGPAAIGIGIFLEELRQRDRERFRRPILEFYEACDYLGRRQSSGPEETRPETVIIDRLLRSRNRLLNRRGNERFLKFRALLEIIAEEQSVPQEFKHLSRTFCLQELAPLTRLATIIGGRRQSPEPGFSGPRFFDRPS